MVLPEEMTFIALDGHGGPEVLVPRRAALPRRGRGRC